MHAVVPARTEHDLRVHRDVVVLKKLKLLDDIASKPVVKHPAAQFRLCSVDGNIDRHDVIADDAFLFLWAQIRQRDVIAVEKGHPFVVVFDVERVPHARRHLIDEAEDALIGASPDLPGVPLDNPQGFFWVFFDI